MTAAIPLWRRWALAAALTAATVAAGWGRPWWITGPVAALWPGMVFLGMWSDRKGS